VILNRWSDAEAVAWQDKAGADPALRDLALRVYSSRIIGQDPDLVMHGGGNTSLKQTLTDIYGDPLPVIRIKGSGWDLGTIQSAGLPAVRMDALLRLRSLAALSDEDMVNIQRSALLDSGAPNPSVETLLHAWLPHIYVDHTHATPFLALANLPDVAAITREIFGDRLALVPYLMPGFGLARKAAEIWEKNPDCEGLLLVNHGHFTWGPDAKSSYNRLIAQTNDVESWFAQRRPAPLYAVPAMPADVATLLPVLRGALAGKSLPVFDLRPDEAGFLERPDVAELALRGVATPDHVIRTKGHPLWLDRATLAQGRTAIARAMADYAMRYTTYFNAENARCNGTKTQLPPTPGLVWAQGIGIIGVGVDAAAARIAGDIGQQTVRVMADAQAVGRFTPINAADMFDCEYWSLEQAKLGKGSPPPFRGQIVLVTGGAGAIGLATAQAFAAQGAAVFLVDRDPEALARALALLGTDHGGMACDITLPGAAQEAVQSCVLRFGGLDILVSNAGAALQGDVATLPDATLRASFELNFFAHHAFAQAAVAVFRAQANHAGQLLFNVSKQAVNPGKGFAAYGLPKATTMFLLRQLALELGPEGVRVNGINADRIRSGLLNDAMITARAAARKVDEATYMAGNLLGAEVEARHVADAFVMLARSDRTTAHVMTVDGGNIEAALR
jgi:rhamnose utilization protein RhaD (predicted bifunctional aldolase and dehydrogenase)/NAD(P)-dependent dehydrogenase (short-subunit alcohol dehydrogenase family)